MSDEEEDEQPRKQTAYLLNPTFGVFVAPGLMVMSWRIPDIPESWLTDMDRGWRKGASLMRIISMN